MDGITLKGKLYDFIRTNDSLTFGLVCGDTVECRLENSNFHWELHKDGFYDSVSYDPDGWEHARKGEIPFVRISNDDKERIYIQASDLTVDSFVLGDLEFYQGGFTKDGCEIGCLSHDAEETLAYNPDAFFEVDLFQEESAHWNSDDVKVLTAAGFKVSIV